MTKASQAQKGLKGSTQRVILPNISLLKMMIGLPTQLKRENNKIGTQKVGLILSQILNTSTQKIHIEKVHLLKYPNTKTILIHNYNHLIMKNQ